MNAKNSDAIRTAAALILDGKKEDANLGLESEMVKDNPSSTACFLYAWSCNTFSEMEAAIDQVLESDPKNELALAGQKWICGVRSLANEVTESEVTDSEVTDADVAEECNVGNQLPQAGIELVDFARGWSEVKQEMQLTDDQADTCRIDKQEAEEQRLREEAEALQIEQQEAEEQRLREEAAAKKEAEEQRLQEEAAAKKEAEEQRLQEEAAAKKEAEEQRLQEEAAAKKQAEEQRLQEEAAAKKEAEELRLQEEAAAKKQAEELRLQEEAAAKKRAEELRLQEEAAAKKRAEEQRLQEEAAAKKQAEELRLQEEAAAKKQAEELRLQEEAAAKKEAEAAQAVELTEESIHETVKEISNDVQTAVAPTASSDTTSQFEDESKPLVLTVDDSPTIRKLVSMTLSREGFNVISACDGVEALTLLGETMPAIILSDINMPRLDGYKLCKFVKKHKNTKHIPVLMLSGKDGVFDKMRGKMSGCDGYIVKPFESNDLLAKVKKFTNVNA